MFRKQNNIQYEVHVLHGALPNKQTHIKIFEHLIVLKFRSNEKTEF